VAQRPRPGEGDAPGRSPRPHVGQLRQLASPLPWKQPAVRPGAELGEVLGLLRAIRRRWTDIPFDVLVGNLPNYVTESLIDILDRVSFGTAVLAVGEATDLGRLQPGFAVTEVTTISGDDFQPPQPSVSRIVKVARTSGQS
jgi:hypothetical protein